MSPEAAQYNLAGPRFSSLWQEGLYDLDTWGSGHCHTFNPDTSSYAGFQGQLYAHLGELIATVPPVNMVHLIHLYLQVETRI